MLVEVGSFCTSKLSSALQQDFRVVICNFFKLQGGIKRLDDEPFGSCPLCQIFHYFSFAVIMSEINPTNHKSITASHFPDEDFRGAVSELVES